MRWAQLNLTEDDPANMDIGFWLDYFKRIHADAVCLTAGGVVAFYPTQLPLHHRRRIQLLVNGAAPAIEASRGYVSLTVPSIADHEVIAIDFA